MASTLPLTGYADLVNATKVEYGPQRIEQIAQNFVDYPLFSLFFRKERQELSDGQLIQRNVNLKKVPVARAKGLMQKDVVNIQNTTAQAQVPWRFYDTHWGFTEQEVWLNRGKSRIFSLIDNKRYNAYLDLIEVLENHLWIAPAASDQNSLYGVPYYVVTNATQGFQGGHPAGHNAVANISATTNSHWRNYTGSYSSVTKTSLLRLMRAGCRNTHFRSLEGMDPQTYIKNRDNYVFFTNEPVAQALEELGEAQNENIGRDLATYQVPTGTGSRDIYSEAGVLTFRRFPIRWAPYLNTYTTDPIYGLNLGTFFMYVHSEYNMKEQPVKVSDDHLSNVVYMDIWCQLLCIDRRRNMVFHKV